MSGTVTYKGATLTTISDGSTKILKTAGKFMEDDVTIAVSSSGGGSGNVWQDENGYIHLSDEGDGGLTPTPSTSWVRPSEWPDLSLLDVSAGDILYMTSYADEAKGFCSFIITCTGSYTVAVGHLSGSTFIPESTNTYTSGTQCDLYYGSVNGTYKVLKVTGTAITKLRFLNNSSITINNFKGYLNNQGIIDIVGKLPSCDYLLFSNQYNIINIEITNVILSGTGATFTNCYSLINLNTTDWDTSLVTNMGSMFASCYSLTNLDVSGWNTNSVTNMGTMFTNCYSLTNLDVSNWNTGLVTSMYQMFYGCCSLTNLDVSNWNTEKVTTMSGMFNNCYSLTNLDVSNWNTGLVTAMSSMFYNCYSLTNLDVSNWNTEKVTTMSGMFNSCYSLINLDVSNWNTSLVTSMSNMFYNCCSLIILDVSNFNTSLVTTMTNMFYCCRSLAYLDVSNFNFIKITSATSSQSMFNGNYGLHGSITLPASFNFIGSSCFQNCLSLYEWHFLSTTPPTLSNTNAFTNMADFGGKKIYVPVGCADAYKTASNWSTYANYIFEEGS